MFLRVFFLICRGMITASCRGRNPRGTVLARDVMSSLGQSMLTEYLEMRHAGEASDVRV